MRGVSNLNAAKNVLRVDSRSIQKKSRGQEPGTSKKESRIARLTSCLVVTHGVSIDDTIVVLDSFEVTDWDDFVSIQQLRRKTMKLLGGEKGEEVFAVLRAAAPKSSK